MFSKGFVPGFRVWVRYEPGENSSCLNGRERFLEGSVAPTRDQVRLFQVMAPDHAERPYKNILDQWQIVLLGEPLPRKEGYTVIDRTDRIKKVSIRPGTKVLPAEWREDHNPDPAKYKWYFGGILVVSNYRLQDLKEQSSGVLKGEYRRNAAGLVIFEANLHGSCTLKTRRSRARHRFFSNEKIITDYYVKGAVYAGFYNGTEVTLWEDESGE